MKGNKVHCLVRCLVIRLVRSRCDKFCPPAVNGEYACPSGEKSPHIIKISSKTNFAPKHLFMMPPKTFSVCPKTFSTANIFRVPPKTFTVPENIFWCPLHTFSLQEHFVECPKKHFRCTKTFIGWSPQTFTYARTFLPPSISGCRCAVILSILLCWTLFAASPLPKGLKTHNWYCTNKIYSILYKYRKGHALHYAWPFDQKIKSPKTQGFFIISLLI